MSNHTFVYPRLVALAAVGLLLASCGSQTRTISINLATEAPGPTKSFTYPALYEDSFTISCEGTGGSYSYCTCALRQIETAVPYSTAVAAQHDIAIGNPPGWFVAAAGMCRGQ